MTDDPTRVADTAMLRAIDERRAEDPLVGAKMAAKEILGRLMNAVKGERGVHVESLFCALGSLAGYACQAGIRAQAEREGKPPEVYFNVAETKDGRHYFFGDALNRPLAEDRHSVWSLAAGAAAHLGAQQIPKVEEYFRVVAADLGSEKFGVVQYLPGASAGDTPINYVKVMWPHLQPMVEKYTGDPTLWGTAFGLAIQEGMTLAKDVIPPAAALSIVMQSAVPMSKITLSEH